MKELIDLSKPQTDGKRHLIHLSLNMESIEGMLGVSTNCLSGGFTTEETIKICYDAGLMLGNSLTSVDICEYNPYVEDWRTGR